MTIDLPYKNIPGEELNFISNTYQALTDMILHESDTTEEGTQELAKIPLAGTVGNLIDSINECEQEWLMEEFDFNKINRVLFHYESIGQEELDSDEELSAIYFLHSYTLDLADALLEEFIVPAVACNQLHKEWQKKHGD